MRLPPPRPARPSAGRRLTLAVRPLEPRDVPAGNVTTALSQGTLILTGDRLANDVTVSQPAPGTITVTPAAGTTVNGGTDPVTVPGLTANLVVRLGAGDDRLAFDLAGPIALPGRLVVDYGTAGTGPDARSG